MEKEPFDQYLQTKNLAQNTRSGYRKATDKFLKWYGKTPINCTKKEIINYLSFLKRTTDQSANTKYQSLIALKHYFNYLITEGRIAKNPTTHIKIRGIRRKFLYRIFSTEELAQLADDNYNVFVRNYDDSRTPINRKFRSELNRKRSHIILQLLVNQGLVTGEISRITLNDLDLNRATIIIKGTRRSNARTLQLQASQIGAIINYLQNIRPRFLQHYEEDTDQFILLLSEDERKKRKISYNYNNLFLKLAEQIRKIHPEFLRFKQIRASVITNWIKTDGLRKAQYFAGHRYISTTENYKVNDLESLIGDIAKNHPLQ